MKLFFYVKFEPIPETPGLFESELIGFSSDPLMAMADLQRMGEDLVARDSSATCILYEGPAAVTDLSRLPELVPYGFPASNSGVTAIGIMNKAEIFFLKPADQREYIRFLWNYPKMSAHVTARELTLDWQHGFARDDGRLQRLMNNPRSKGMRFSIHKPPHWPEGTSKKKPGRKR